jgi:hypothetical protein
VWALLMKSRQLVLLQRELRDRTWRTVASLRADRFGVLNALVSIRGAKRLRLEAGLKFAATAAVADRRGSWGVRSG